MTNRRYKRPESVLVVVYTPAGEVLMLRRKSPDDFWQSVTGSLRWGESPLQAARRELYEETRLMEGCALIDLHHQVEFPIITPWRARYAPNARTNREHWFALPLNSRRIPHLNPTEHTAYRWLSTLEKGAQLATSWTNRDAIRLLAGRPIRYA
ncbi:dihydroneopterin triphosphate diphosphatase [endosymbiont of Lamellibrachia barhami]|uniref:dihydroneopterin triphosphate diphosphatase n=1 Tax=endosymbiont of Lamellibrachia barhami TaxID=205975 RepID=UPI0015A9940E|nr:dihydroneopterin triphosphate diphosphatase [endosymbiont of Lamellibrachia barhami]